MLWVFAALSVAFGLGGAAHVAGGAFSRAFDPLGREASDVGATEVAGVTPLRGITVPRD